MKMTFEFKVYDDFRFVLHIFDIFLAYITFDIFNSGIFKLILDILCFVAKR